MPNFLYYFADWCLLTLTAYVCVRARIMTLSTPRLPTTWQVRHVLLVLAAVANETSSAAGTDNVKPPGARMLRLRRVVLHPCRSAHYFAKTRGEDLRVAMEEQLSHAHTNA